jgi:DNA primase
LIEQLVAGEAAERGVARERVRFTRRQLRELLGWGDTQLKVHLARLVSLELVWAHRGAHGAHVYELAWDGDSQGDWPHLAGLIDPDTLDVGEPAVEEPHVYDTDRSGPQADRSGGGRRAAGARSTGGRGDLVAVGG